MILSFPLLSFSLNSLIIAETLKTEKRKTITYEVFWNPLNEPQFFLNGVSLNAPSCLQNLMTFGRRCMADEKARIIQRCLQGVRITMRYNLEMLFGKRLMSQLVKKCLSIVAF